MEEEIDSLRQEKAELEAALREWAADFAQLERDYAAATERLRQVTVERVKVKLERAAEKPNENVWKVKVKLFGDNFNDRSTTSKNLDNNSKRNEQQWRKRKDNDFNFVTISDSYAGDSNKLKRRE